MSHDEQAFARYAEQLRRGYREAHRPSPEQADALWAKLEAPAVPLAPAASSSSPSRRGVAVALFALAAAILLMVFGTSWWSTASQQLGMTPGSAPFIEQPRPDEDQAAVLRRSAAAERETSADAAAVPPDAPAVSSVDPSDETDPSASSPAVPPTAARSPRRRPEPSAAEVAPELELMRTAHDASRRGNWSQVLAELATHRRYYRRGSLSEERDALEIIALCRLGRMNKAIKRRRAFAKRYPGSLHEARIDAACPPR